MRDGSDEWVIFAQPHC